QLVDDEVRGGQVGVADPEGDDVDAGRLALGDLAVDLGEEVRRDGVDAAGGAHELGDPLPSGSGSGKVAAYRSPLRPALARRLSGPAARRCRCGPASPRSGAPRRGRRTG